MTGGAFVSVGDDDGADTSKLTGHAHIYGPKLLRLPVLTVGLLGMQLFWSVEQSYGSPYLLSLGLSKSAMAMVFLAGPLSGLIMQPLIGVLADSCTSRFGRRRPYMAGGVAVCVLAMLLLGWTKAVAGWFSSSQTLVIILAVLSIYIIDFSINAVMAVDRALLIDTLPPSEQPSANAWAARMMSLGGVTGFFVGNLNLPSLFPFLGDTELQVLSVVASFILIAGHLVTMFMVKEKVLLKTDSSRSAKAEILQQFRDLWTNMSTLPRVIKQICIIQFFTWIAWFPVLFYTTLYIGDLYKRSYYASLAITETVGSTTVNMLGGTITERQTVDEQYLEEEATRLGSRALFFSALVSLIGNFVLPLFAFETQKKTSSRIPTTRSCRIPDMFKFHLASLWATAQAVFSLCMMGTFFTTSVNGATALITVTGFSWAVIMWVPFALLGEAILTEPASGTTAPAAIMLTDTRSRPREESETLFEDAAADSDAESDQDVDREEARSKLMGNHRAGVSGADLRAENYDLEDDEDEDAVLVGRRRDLESTDVDNERAHEGGLSKKVGIILGIQNIFVVIPQFIVTGLASIIFAIFDPRIPPGDDPSSSDNSTISALLRDDAREVALSKAANSNTVVYVFRLGGISALIAFVLCFRLARELNHR